MEVFNSQDLTKARLLLKKDFPKYLERDYINQVIAAMPVGRDRMLVMFLWMTGVRVTEAINLSKGEIDFQNRMMNVKWLKSRKYYRRNVPIHSRLSSILEVYTTALKADDKIFPVSRQRVFQITKQWLNCSPHQLRHSFAVNWLREKADIFILNRVLGHARMQTTMEYLKIVPVDQGKELEKVNFW